MTLDPERILALSHVAARLRPGLRALWELDAALGAVLAAGRDPDIMRIKLAWWRESLEALDGAPPPPEPVLEAIARHVIPIVPGAALAGMEQGWAWLLEPELEHEGLDAHARGRGKALFAFSARLLGDRDEGNVAAAGETWALADLARRSARAGEREMALAAARGRLPDMPRRWPAPLRPLGMLAVLAARDAGRSGELEPQGSPARMLRMLRHRLTGR